MNDDDLRTQLRRDLDSTPAWPLDVDEAAGRAHPHRRLRTAMTAVSVVAALGLTVAALVALSSVRQGPRGSLGSTHSGAPGGTHSAAPGTPSTSAPPSVEPPTSTEARFTCDGSTTLPAEVTVAAERDGVHIVVDNTSSEAMGFDYPLGGTNAPRGTHELEGPGGGSGWPLGPGDYAVKCVPNSASDRDSVPGATLHVVDPSGFWVSDALQCRSGERFGSNADFGPGSGTSLEDAVHSLLDGYAVSGDVIVQVGYPDAFSPEFALSRDGRLIVLAKPAHLPNDRWLASEASGCSGEDRVKGGFHAPIRDR